MTEGYLRKMGVVIWMRGREGGEIMVDNGSCPTPAGTVGSPRTGKLLHTWRSLELKNRPETGNLPLAGDRIKTTVQTTNIGTNVINNDRATAMLASLVISTIITTT